MTEYVWYSTTENDFIIATGLDHIRRMYTQWFCEEAYGYYDEIYLGEL